MEIATGPFGTLAMTKTLVIDKFLSFLYNLLVLYEEGLVIFCSARRSGRKF